MGGSSFIVLLGFSLMAFVCFFSSFLVSVHGLYKKGEDENWKEIRLGKGEKT